jgi:hypothetical protein
VHQRPELSEVVADKGEVVLVVELPDRAHPVQARSVAELDAQGVAGVRRVGDHAVLAERRGDLLDQPRLRVDRVDVEVARH